MLNSRTWRVVGAAALLAGATSARAADDLVPENFWRDPRFVAAFAGSYGINSATEPPLAPDEQSFLIEIAAIIPTNQPLAIARMEAAIETGKSLVTPVAPPVADDQKPRRKKPEVEPREVPIHNVARLHYMLGNLHVQAGDTEAAIRRYRAAIDAFPAYLNAHKNLGIVLVRAGQLAEAPGSLRRALELGAVDGNLYGLLGSCYLQAQQYRSAELAFNQATLLAPDRKEWRLGAARALFAQARYDAAAGLFGELIATDPAVADYWLFQANCFIALNQPLQAAYNYEVVRELGAARPATLFALGDIYLSRELPATALAAYLAGLEQEPAAGVNSAIRAAEVLAARRATPQAAALLVRLRERAGGELDPAQTVRVLRLESKLALARGDDERAAGIMEDLLAQDPDDGEILLLLARYYGRVDRVAEAEMLFARAARLPKYEAEACLRHAQMLAGPKQQRFGRAIELLKRAQQIEPKENVQRYLEALERRAAAARG